MSYADLVRGVDVAAIAEVLGEAGHDPAYAQRWAKAGRRASLVELYCRVGVWHPGVAAVLEDAGLGVGELAHYQRHSWGDTLEHLDGALAWLDGDEAPEMLDGPADIDAARACLEAVHARHAAEAQAGETHLPVPWEVEDDWLHPYRRPRVQVAVMLIETASGVLEVWPNDAGYIADPEADDDEDDRHRPAPCRLHRGVRLDDHDAVSVLEDFLEEHVDVGPGIVHWEATGIYVPLREGEVPARVGLVFAVDDDHAHWRYVQRSLYGTLPAVVTDGE